VLLFVYYYYYYYGQNFYKYTCFTSLSTNSFYVFHLLEKQNYLTTCHFHYTSYPLLWVVVLLGDVTLWISGVVLYHKHNIWVKKAIFYTISCVMIGIGCVYNFCKLSTTWWGVNVCKSICVVYNIGFLAKSSCLLVAKCSLLSIIYYTIYSQKKQYLQCNKCNKVA